LALKGIIGLGNPGNRYQNTRHNLGFLVVDKLLNYMGGDLKTGKGDYWYYKDGMNCILAKPTSYMNRSGIAVQQLSSYFKIAPQDLLIVLDDLDLELGQIRLRPGGSAAGHKGMQSVMDMLPNAEIPRLRMGINTIWRRNLATEDYVLMRFTPDEMPIVETMVESASEAAVHWLKHGTVSAMNQYNRRIRATETNEEGTE
jgi:peptidyl-tRNA hydrolase, PTH1 family